VGSDAREVSTIYVLIHTIEDSQAFWEEAGFDTWLSPREKERLTALRFQKRRNEWLHGRWVAKQLLKRVCPSFQALPLSDMVIDNLLDGSPIFMTQDQEVSGDLSISHREGWACVAFSSSGNFHIGIDVEKVEKRELAFYTDYFSDREIEGERLFPLSREAYFTLLWSAKESVVKALKTGLRIDVQKIEVFPQKFERETVPSPPPYGWLAFSCQVSGMDGNWVGFWQKREEFIITLACRCVNQKEPVSLQEIRL